MDSEAEEVGFDKEFDDAMVALGRSWMLAKYVFVVVVALLLAGLSCFLLACASVSTETVEVKVPVAVRVVPPPELTAPLAVDPLPVFVAPADPAATSALTPQGERDLQQLLLELLTRLRAWAVWAATPEDRTP